MQISCSLSSTRPSVLTIFCDGSPWRDIHPSVFGRRPVFPQQCASLEEWHEQFTFIEYRQTKNYALRRLALQGMLSSALATSLKERLVSEKVIHQVIQELVSLGFINDQEWTASFVRSQTNRKVGPRAIAQKLANKGVRGERLEQALEKSWSVADQKTLILQLLNTRYSRRNLVDFKEKQKVVASLVRKGFDVSVILSCLKPIAISCPHS